MTSVTGCKPRSYNAKDPAVAPAPKVITNSIGMKFVKLNGGSFLMGHPSFPLAAPVHRVTVSPFLIGQYEVTNQQFEQFRKRTRITEAPSALHPALNVGWSDAVAFCRWLSKREGRTYRLPTEAEWEFAARGGLQQADYPWGNEEPDGRAHFRNITAAPVGSYPPNAYGLYDMAGNAAEWVADWGDELPDGKSAYYSRSALVDPKGPKSGFYRVLRGGSFGVWELNVYFRQPSTATGVAEQFGFRVVREAE